jgi:hypothetical protein
VIVTFESFVVLAAPAGAADTIHVASTQSTPM